MPPPPFTSQQQQDATQFAPDAGNPSTWNKPDFQFLESQIQAGDQETRDALKQIQEQLQQGIPKQGTPPGFPSTGPMELEETQEAQQQIIQNIQEIQQQMRQEVPIQNTAPAAPAPDLQFAVPPLKETSTELLTLATLTRDASTGNIDPQAVLQTMQTGAPTTSLDGKALPTQEIGALVTALREQGMSMTGIVARVKALHDRHSETELQNTLEARLKDTPDVAQAAERTTVPQTVASAEDKEKEQTLSPEESKKRQDALNNTMDNLSQFLPKELAGLVAAFLVVFKAPQDSLAKQEEQQAQNQNQKEQPDYSHLGTQGIIEEFKGKEISSNDFGKENDNPMGSALAGFNAPSSLAGFTSMSDAGLGDLSANAPGGFAPAASAGINV